jgi:Tfp pilus assembly protein PilX
MQEVNIYDNSEIVILKKESIIYKLFIIITLTILITLFLLMYFYSYSVNIRLKGIVKDNYINITISETNLKKLTGNILINEKKYKVKMASISL